MSKRTVSPEWSSGRNRLCSAITDGQRAQFVVVERQQVPLDAEVPEQRGDRDGTRGVCVRPVGVRSRRARCGRPSARVGSTSRRRAGSSGARAHRCSRSSTPARCARGSRGRSAPRPTSSTRSRPSGWRARSSSSSRYSASVWACVPAAPSAPDRLHVVAVHVPLDVGDVVVARAARRAGRARASYASGSARSSTSWLRPSTGS